MPALDNPRWERFAQNLAAGMPQTEAYGAAGYSAHAGSATALRKNPLLSARVSELQRAGARAAEAALTAKQRFISKAWEAAATAVEAHPPEEVSDIKALVDAALAAEKDQRVLDGGVSDRTAQVAAVDIAAAAREAAEMLASLAQRTGGDDAGATKH